jgi:hypothetical protein
MPCCPPCHQDVARSARHRLSLSLRSSLPKSRAAQALVARRCRLHSIAPERCPSPLARPRTSRSGSANCRRRACRSSNAVARRCAMAAVRSSASHRNPELPRYPGRLLAPRRAAASPQRCRPRHLFIFIETRSVPCPLLKFMIVISHLYESEKKRAPVLILYFGHSPTLEIYIK